MFSDREEHVNLTPQTATAAAAAAILFKVQYPRSSVDRVKVTYFVDHHG